MKQLSISTKLRGYLKNVALHFSFNSRYCGLAILLASPLYANADAIDRSQARIVAQNIVSIDDTAPDDVALAPYYIFSRGVGKGYVIVSGDDSTAPIIGYTDMGDYVEGQLPAPLQNLLNSWAEKIKKLQEQNPTKAKSKMSPAKAKQRFALASYKKTWVEVPVLMTTHWHQSYPYNMLAPHRTDNNNQALTGCLATAASQIVYYFRKDNPKETLYDTPTYGYGGAPVTKSLPKGTPLRYDLMKNSGTGSLKQDSAVAVLMYAAGTSAWLTYGDGSGTATSGQNYKMGDAIRGQFALNNDCLYKESFSQQAWETKVYNNLISGRPMLYTGASEKDGGHAVVLDGYQATTGLYHFNFGWGGQGDGWYTIDDETGMNGFNSYQSMLSNITPKNQNFTARILSPTLYEKTTCTINVMVNNDATLAQSKFYLYCSTTNTKPSSPTAKDESTIIETGDSAKLSFSYKAINANKPVNIWLYDANGKLLDNITAEVLPTKSALTLKNISADTSADITTIGNYKFHHLNNTTANISVSLANSDEGTICQPTLKCAMFEYDKETNTWATDSTTKIINSLKFDVGETRDTIFQFKYLKAGSLYKVRLVPVATTSTKDPINVDIADSEVYFQVFEPSLAVTANGRQAIVTGGWNPTIFTEIATDSHVTTYDMTAVSGLSSQPKAANKNALFYSNSNVEGISNLIVDSRCNDLIVNEGYDFLPRNNFHAAKAKFMTLPAEKCGWGALALPFAATTPKGVQVRKITGISSVKLIHSHNSEIAAATPFVYLPSTPAFTGFEATDVNVNGDSIYTSHHDSITVNTVNTIAADRNMTLGLKNNLPYFIKTEAETQIASFSVIINANIANGIRIYNEPTIDRAYTVFADSLYSAHQALASHPENSQCTQFADSIAAYTLAFDSYAFDNNKDITNAAKQLGTLIQQFLSEELPSAIYNIPTDSTNDYDTNAPVRYYSIDGTQLTAPRRGIIIIKQGNKVRKVKR